MEQIETKIAFLEGAVAELSNQVYRQHQEIMELRAQLSALIQRLAAQQSAQPAPTAEEERPPHY